jgi:alpha-galactosidase
LKHIWQVLIAVIFLAGTSSRQVSGASANTPPMGMMTLWSISRSPLIMGGNLLELDEWTRSLLANEEVIKVNQHSKDNRQALKDGELVVWTARLQSGNGYFIALFNTGDSELSADRSWKDMSVEEKSYNIRDLWERKNVNKANRLRVRLSPHASAMWKVQ